MINSDIIHKRSIITSARIRFSPTTQPIKEAAIDKIIEHTIFASVKEIGLSKQDIQNEETICFGEGIPAINISDITASIQRLVNQGILNVKENKYSLSDQRKEELKQSFNETKKRIDRINRNLFIDAEVNPNIYTEPFIECLCIIFAELGENYVRVIKGEITGKEFLSIKDIYNTLDKIRTKYNINYDILKNALFKFFESHDPDFVALKWNLAQNYYILMALGLDPSGYLFSKEMFTNSILYLDTNVIIDAIESKVLHHKRFETLYDACKKLKIKLAITRISLDELNNVITYYKDNILKVIDQIPKDTLPKIDNIFINLYKEKIKKGDSIDFDEIIDRFLNAEDELSKSYDLELIDDIWFDNEINTKKTKDAKKIIRKENINKTHFRIKGDSASLHDALLLRWIEKEREKGNTNTLLVTLDTTLPNYLSSNANESKRALSITLDALLQWITPIAIEDSEDSNDDIAQIFSETLKSKFLPQETIFKLEDFYIFADMQWSCKELPAEDVEGCIRHIKMNFHNLDPNEPGDREKLAYEINKYFINPSRKYRQEVEKLEGIIKTLKISTDQIVESRDKIINELIEWKEDQENKEKHRKLKKSAIRRLIIIIISIIIYEAFFFHLIINFGEKIEFLKKNLSLFILQIPSIIMIVSTWFVLGKERIKALGWPFTKILK